MNAVNVYSTRDSWSCHDSIAVAGIFDHQNFPLPSGCYSFWKVVFHTRFSEGQHIPTSIYPVPTTDEYKKLNLEKTRKNCYRNICFLSLVSVEISPWGQTVKQFCEKHEPFKIFPMFSQVSNIRNL